MKTYKKLYHKIFSRENLLRAWKRARKGKTKKFYVIEFQKNLIENLGELQKELESETYIPQPLKTFILRDPKTRRISKAHFRDRVVHHAIVNIIEPIFEKIFIFDSCANRIGKGSLFALKRFDYFKRKVSENGKPVSNKFDDNFVKGYCLKADIKHYFQEVDHEILISLIEEKIRDESVIKLIRKILINGQYKEGVGMPLGNLTSQFLANVYLNKLDYFAKHKLKAKYYIRYVDDFTILYDSKEQLEIWKDKIDNFLREKLKLELHPSKSHVLRLSCGINFLGFRVFFHHKLLRKSNLQSFERKFNQIKIMFKEGMLNKEQVLDFLEGWLAYASHANCHKYKKHLIRQFNKEFPFENYKEDSNKKILNFLKKVDESELDFSVQKTLLMYTKGLGIKEIAINRGIKEATVWGHLANLIEHKQILVRNVLPEDKILKILKKIYSSKDRLRDIKKRLDDSTITFDEIACVMASIWSKKRVKMINKMS